MSKKTAVDWLFKQISSSKYFYYLMEDINNRNTVEQSDIFDQAKEMEKERMFEIMDAYADDVMGGCTIRAKEWYYNENFKN